MVDTKRKKLIKILAWTVYVLVLLVMASLVVWSFQSCISVTVNSAGVNSGNMEDNEETDKQDNGADFSLGGQIDDNPQ